MRAPTIVNARLPMCGWPGIPTDWCSTYASKERSSRRGAAKVGWRTATDCRYGSIRARRSTSIAPAGIAIATRFCRPAADSGQAEPVADQLLINRARENARPIRPRELQVASRVTKSGYWLAAFVPAVALGGYDPHQYRQIGFTYAVYDRELGLQTFATGAAIPVR